jgi:riboflavin synthase
VQLSDYNFNARNNYAFHLEVVNGISSKRAELIAGDRDLFMALVDGLTDKGFNEESLAKLMTIPGIKEETAKRYIEEYAKQPFADVNWEVKRQLDLFQAQNPDAGLTTNKIYKIAKAVDDLSNPWIAYRAGALSYDLVTQIYIMFTNDSEEKVKNTLAVWDAEYQMRRNEGNNLITIKQSENVLDQHALDDFGVVTPFMDGWARTDTLRAYKIVEDTLRNNAGATVRPTITETDMSDLFPDQVDAVEKIISQPISFLTGYAGTGKTFVIKKVLEALGYATPPNIFADKPNYAVATALAGKAVKNFRESVAGISIEMTTIAGVKNVSKYRQLFAGASTIVIDEFSMVSLQDLAFLFKLNPEARYIFIGDSNQLPAIGLDVLNRLEDEELLVPIKLTIPKRQGADSGIFLDSMEVIEGRVPQFSHDDSRVYYNSDNHEWTIEEIIANNPNADVFLTTSNGAKNLINEIKHAEVIGRTSQENWLNFDGRNFYAAGDKLIVGKNNPDTGFMNGDIFTVVFEEGDFHLRDVNGNKALLEDNRWEPFNGETFDFQKHKAELGFAITVHKSQGSTIQNVVSILGYSPLQSRNILYTALTRAKESHVLYMPSQRLLEEYLETKVSYQAIDIDLLDLDVLENNEAIERANGFKTLA